MKVVEDSNCRVCSKDEEDTQHVLSECPALRITRNLNGEKFHHQECFKVYQKYKVDGVN